MIVVAIAAVAGAIPVQARQLDPNRKIRVACASATVHMAAISKAVKNSNYWASQTARRQMLSLAQQACARGATVVTFVPPVVERSCATPPTWSTLCVDRVTKLREVETVSALPSSSAHE